MIGTTETFILFIKARTIALSVISDQRSKTIKFLWFEKLLHVS